MLRFNKLCSILIFGLAVLPASSEETGCLSTGPGGQGECALSRLVEMKKKMEAMLAELNQAINESPEYTESARSAVRASQQAWREYKDKECQLKYELFPESSEWKATHKVQCEAELTKARTQDLAAHLSCVKSFGYGCSE